MTCHSNVLIHLLALTYTVFCCGNVYHVPIDDNFTCPVCRKFWWYDGRKVRHG